MRRLLLIVVAILVAGAIAFAIALGTPSGLAKLWPSLPASLQTRPSLYVRHALGIIEQQAALADNVDWPATIAHATDMAKNAGTSVDTYPAIRYAIEQLKDGTSALALPPNAGNAPPGVFGFTTLFPERVVALVYPQSAAATAGIQAGDVIEQVNGAPPVASSDPRNRGYFVNIPTPSATLRVRHPAAKDARDVTLTVGSYIPLPALALLIGGNLGYVEIPATSGQDQFAERVRESILQRDAPSLCGWIVDLRFDNGGELWAMLQALRPLLGEPPLGSFVARGGTQTPWAFPTSGPFALPKPEQALKHPNPPVAVLTSRLTSRSGELAAIAFRGRPDTRLFGEATWGSPFETTSYRLPDGARLDLATARAADRTGHAYDTRIAPDVDVTVDWARLARPDDPVIIAAGTWIRAQPGCKK